MYVLPSLYTLYLSVCFYCKQAFISSSTIGFHYRIERSTINAGNKIVQARYGLNLPVSTNTREKKKKRLFAQKKVISKLSELLSKFTIKTNK